MSPTTATTIKTAPTIRSLHSAEEARQAHNLEVLGSKPSGAFIVVIIHNNNNDNNMAIHMTSTMAHLPYLLL